MFFWFKNKTVFIFPCPVRVGKNPCFRKQWIWPPSVVSVIPLETPS